MTGLGDYVEDYQKHPEAKAADQGSNPAGPETIGLLRRLPVRSRKLARIGKELDRVGEEEGASLEPDRPIEFERDSLAQDIAYLAEFPQKLVAERIGMSERRWRDIAQGKTQPRATTAARIVRIANDWRLGED